MRVLIAFLIDQYVVGVNVINTIILKLKRRRNKSPILRLSEIMTYPFKLCRSSSCSCFIAQQCNNILALFSENFLDRTGVKV